MKKREFLCVLARKRAKVARKQAVKDAKSVARILRGLSDVEFPLEI